MLLANQSRKIRRMLLELRHHRNLHVLRSSNTSPHSRGLQHIDRSLTKPNILAKDFMAMRIRTPHIDLKLHGWCCEGEPNFLEKKLSFKIEKNVLRRWIDV